jgi:hypothetical protein
MTGTESARTLTGGIAYPRSVVAGAKRFVCQVLNCVPRLEIVFAARVDARPPRDWAGQTILKLKIALPLPDYRLDLRPTVEIPISFLVGDC